MNNLLNTSPNWSLQSQRTSHVSDHLPPASFVDLVRQVFAGCSEPLLEGGPSRRYLCNPCLGARTPTPQRPFGAYPFLPKGHRPHPTVEGFGTLNDRRNATSTTISFRGCSHSLMFGLPCLLGPQVAPTTAVSSPQGRRAVYTTQDPCRYRT